MRYFVILSLLVFSPFIFGQNEKRLIFEYIEAHPELRIAFQSENDFEIVSRASSRAANAGHVYIRQLVSGIPVNNGLATVTFKNGSVFHIASRLKNIAPGVVSQPSIPAEMAVSSYLSSKGKSVSDLKQLSASQNTFVFTTASVRGTIPAALCFVADNSGGVRLCWDISADMGSNWWSTRIDAETGEVVEENDWIKSCDFEHSEDTEQLYDHQVASPESAVSLPSPPPGADQYRVYALPVESPAHGNRTLLINPSDPVASPYGWHDMDGIPGDEATTTMGNNVAATEDIDNDDEPGYYPDGGTALNFDFAYDSLTGVQGNLDAVITNLFYMNNMMHDIWFHYGFDEISGNFQQMNYSGDGAGEDPVFAQAQDGSGTNNANFGTPPDGFSPSMQMYLWTENNVPDLLTVNSPSAIAQTYVSSTAGFGPPIPSIPITQDVVLVDDGIGTASDGCETILNGAAMNGKIALVRRGTCTFAEKVEACEAEGAVAVIVMNNTGGQPISMGGDSDTGIPSLMISQADGNLFVQQIGDGETINATIVNPGDLTATDSDFDNMIIAHEYGHGISTRLTGGADNSECLYNDEQMGEGWSDWFGLMLTLKPGDLAEAPRGVGTYVTNQAITGTGIRPAPYSTSFAVNDYTYGSTNSPSISMPHGIGFVWASMLWDLNWALIDEYGFDADVKHGEGGNNRAMALVIEGLKLQPCSPGFVDGRDAILEADELLYDGANKCLIWEVFARRGLGYSADQGSSDSRSDQTQAFDTHPSCLPNVGILEKTLDMVQIYPNPATDVLTIDMSNYADVKTIRVTDLQGKVLFRSENVDELIETIDVSGWRSGLYLVSLTDTKGTKTVEIIRR